MIGTVLEQVKEYVNVFISGAEPAVEIENISQLDVGVNTDSDILMSLVNIEQDVPLRNNPNHTYISDTKVKYHNPRVFLNLYVLFASRHKSDNLNSSLNTITEVIAAFQKRNVFLASDPDMNFTSVGGNLQTEKIIFDQYSMTFEQLNHLWGILGGKYLPSVLYKVRLVSVFVDEGTEGLVVRSIERRESVIN